VEMMVLVDVIDL